MVHYYQYPIFDLHIASISHDFRRVYIQLLYPLAEKIQMVQLKDYNLRQSHLRFSVREYGMLFQVFLEVEYVLSKKIKTTLCGLYFYRMVIFLIVEPIGWFHQILFHSINIFGTVDML